MRIVNYVRLAGHFDGHPRRTDGSRACPANRTLAGMYIPERDIHPLSGATAPGFARCPVIAGMPVEAKAAAKAAKRHTANLSMSGKPDILPDMPDIQPDIVGFLACPASRTFYRT